IRNESPNLKLFAIGENGRKPGVIRQINNKPPVGDVFQLISDDDSVHTLPRHRAYDTPIFSLLKTFERRAQERNPHLSGGLPRRRDPPRYGPYLARTEEPHLRCCRNGFVQDLQTLAQISSPASTLTPVMLPPGRARLVTMPKGTGSAMLATTGIVCVAALKLRTRREADVTITSGFVPTTSRQSSG